MNQLPGWTPILARRIETERFNADMVELATLAEKIYNTLKITNRRPQYPKPGQIHRDTYLAVNSADIELSTLHFGLAADIGLCTSWPWDLAEARIAAWGKEIKERKAA